MITKLINPRKALNKAFLKVKPIRTDIERFKSNLISLLDRSNDTESEEFHKNLVTDFLKKTYYDPNHYINTKGKNDLVIHNGSTAESTVAVIIETKKPTNKGEMISKTKLNTKAFQELILYYLRERITHKNLEVKHLVATNITEWFIFDATLFERLFAQNKSLVKQFNDFEEGRLSDRKTEFFYKNIAEPFVEGITTEIEFTYFNILDFDKPLRNNNKADDNSLIALFKLLSPEHLLKLPFTNDSNSLDKRFYSELLHILGLTETKDGSKKLIERKKEGERNTGTILEDAIIQLDTLDKINQLDKPSQYGNTQQERLFNVALELSITWINRILFLKLLEAQLITYHKGDISYSFLNQDFIANYDDLNSLFFQVLARKQEERNEDVKKQFEKVPYLNSSLFEPTEIEQKGLFISNLKDDKAIPIYSLTVLKDKQGKKRTGNLTTLQYLLDFLDSYDFGAEGGEDIQEENKTLINASVLGLIFEKINGYKDGSFFTPGFITMYMCRETIRRAVTQKFNDEKSWNCKEFNELYDNIEFQTLEGRNEANRIINSIKICDPAVGSGHFLVSALNEMIAIKNDLKILQDRDGKRLKEYQVEVVNDELIITDEDGDLFEYSPSNKESQRIQETLFHEKQTIIENCLFGVDINANSVKICRLRLWIELLKNSYYKNRLELETLPNIDINIKCGNSLVSRYSIDSDIKPILKRNNKTIEEYKVAVDTYRNAVSKEQKKAMELIINNIKSSFITYISENDPINKKLKLLKYELLQLDENNVYRMIDIDYKPKNKDAEKAKYLQSEIKKLETAIDEVSNNKIYNNAFEWRIEFPEVLNDEGDFVGFDVVIGNPPYLSYYSRESVGIENNFEEYLHSHYKFLNGYSKKVRKNSLMIFLELGMRLLSQHSILIYICDLNLLEKPSVPIRQYLHSNYNLVEVISNLNVFEDVASGQVVIEIENNKLNENYFRYKSNSFKEFTSVNQITISSPDYSFIPVKENSIIKKIESRKILLEDYFDIKVGMNIGGVKELFLHAENTNANYFKFINGGDNVQRWKISFPTDKQIRKGQVYVDFNKSIEKDIWDRKIGTPSIGETNERFLSHKVIIRQSDIKMSSVLDFEQYHCDYNLFTATSLNNNDDDLYNLVALLNSDAYTYYVIEKRILNIKPGKTPQIRVSDLKTIPYLQFDKATLLEVKYLINQIQLGEIELTDKLNEIVNSLIGLSNDEIFTLKQNYR